MNSNGTGYANARCGVSALTFMVVTDPIDIRGLHESLSSSPAASKEKLKLMLGTISNHLVEHDDMGEAMFMANAFDQMAAALKSSEVRKSGLLQMLFRADRTVQASPSPDS